MKTQVLSAHAIALARELSNLVGPIGAVLPAEGVSDTQPLKHGENGLTPYGIRQCDEVSKTWLSAFPKIAAIVTTPSRQCRATAGRLASDGTEIIEIPAYTAIRCAGNMPLRALLEIMNDTKQLEARLDLLINLISGMRQKPASDSLLAIVDDTPLARLIVYAVACAIHTEESLMKDILDIKLMPLQAIIAGNQAALPKFK